jgi:hypothetical protein
MFKQICKHNLSIQHICQRNMIKGTWVKHKLIIISNFLKE